MGRRLRWFSAGAASAVAASLDIRQHGADAGELVQCDTGSEHEDNARFGAEVAAWLGIEMVTLKSDEYTDVRDVWERTGWINGPKGARCTGEMKLAPRLAYQRHDDVHVFGYTADAHDVERAKLLRATYPELNVVTPLIERGITKAGCLAIMQSVGIKPPVTYEMGFPNANCLDAGCAKAQSPSYWALYRHHFPDRFAETARIFRSKGVRAAIVGQEVVDGKRTNIRAFIDDLPADQSMLNPIAPTCDFLCHIAEQDLAA